MKYFYLFCHVALPVIAPIIIFLLMQQGSILKRLNNLFSLDSRESLIKQRLFWLCLIVPATLFFSFGAVTWSGYEIDLTQSGISTFWNISTFPLALLSTAIPLGVVVASFHSTQQTAEQIREAHVRNKLDTYYLHRTEFFKHFERHEEVNYLGVLSGEFMPHPLLYNNCSPGDPRDGIPKRNEKYFTEIDSSFQSAATFLNALFLDEYSEKVFNIYLCNACVAVHNISRLLGLPEIYRDMASKSLLVQPPYKSGQEVTQYLTVGTTAAEIVAAFRYARDFYVNLGAFYGHEIPELAPHLNYLGSGGKVFTLPGWSNVAKFKDDLLSNYVEAHGFKVTKPSEIIPAEQGLNSR